MNEGDRVEQLRAALDTPEGQVPHAPWPPGARDRRLQHFDDGAEQAVVIRHDNAPLMVRDVNGLPLYQVSMTVPPVLGALDPEITRLRRDAADLTAMRASQTLMLPVGQVMVRDLDVGELYPNTGWLTDLHAWSRWVDHVLRATEVVTIYGVVTDIPELERMQFATGIGRVLAEVNVPGWMNQRWQVVRTGEGREQREDAGLSLLPVWVRPTLLWNPSDRVSVQIQTSARVDLHEPQRHIQLIGFVGERVGVRVGPNAPM